MDIVARNLRSRGVVLDRILAQLEWIKKGDFGFFIPRELRT
jgi:hypothetical protein